MSSKSKHSKKISKVAARTTAVPPSKGRRQDDPPNKANLDAARTAAKHDVMRTITGAKVRAASPPATTPTVVRSKSRTNVTDRTSVQQVVALTATRIPLEKDRQGSKFIHSHPVSRNEVFDHIRLHTWCTGKVTAQLITHGFHMTLSLTRNQLRPIGRS